MAIQVGGTTVIDNSRVLSNVTGLKTVGGTSILGSGNIATGGSSTAGAVGTYAMLQEPGNNRPTILAAGDTLAGSGLVWAALLGRGGQTVPLTDWNNPSGTWRLCGAYSTASYSYNDNPTSVWLRIS